MSWFEYLLTEFAENGSIYDYIFKQHKQPHLPQVKIWGTQIAEGTVMAGQSGQYIVNLAHNYGVSIAHCVCVCVRVSVSYCSSKFYESFESQSKVPTEST